MEGTKLVYVRLSTKNNKDRQCILAEKLLRDTLTLCVEFIGPVRTRALFDAAMDSTVGCGITCTVHTLKSTAAIANSKYGEVVIPYSTLPEGCSLAVGKVVGVTAQRPPISEKRRLAWRATSADLEKGKDGESPEEEGWRVAGNRRGGKSRNTPLPM